ncbi:tyrosine-protein phosphatase [Vagococcus jeotgali]|uniref:tyrosine-protein phosphatase n=1 Tax=Vagococcus jeotgali TaxID=3109030 RepID=UPI002DDC17F5|nr:tyrosine-protein phosphatase [Vagococcus sp. B2T-5]
METIKTIVNFRDLGGITTNDGTKVVHHQFLRSDEVVDVSEADKKALVDTYKLKVIVDFRSQSEVEQAKDDDIPGVKYEYIDILADVTGKGASMDALLNPEAGAVESMMKIYEELVMSESAQKGYSEFLKAFIDHPNETTLFHCYAGKDRTGVAAALILSSLNVSRKNIMEDYLKTNELRKGANEKLLKELKEKGLPEAQIKQASIMLDVDRKYLEHAFSTIEKHYGSVSNYFVKALKLNHGFEEQMQKLYTY